MYAGQGVGLIKEIMSAGQVIRGLVEGAKLIMQQNLSNINWEETCMHLLGQFDSRICQYCNYGEQSGKKLKLLSFVLYMYVYGMTLFFCKKLDYT